MLTWTPGASGVMYRKAMLDEIGLLDPLVLSMGDLGFSIRFATTGRWRIQVVPEIVTDVYKHSDLLKSHPQIRASYSYLAARACYPLARERLGDRYLSVAVDADPGCKMYWRHRRPGGSGCTTSGSMRAGGEPGKTWPGVSDLCTGVTDDVRRIGG